MTLNIGEGLLAVALAGVEPGADGGELSAGDGRLGIEGRGAAALDDAQTGHGGDGGVGPVIVRHVGVGVAGEQIAVTDGILQQAEENGGGLRTGDQTVGPDVAVHVADDIGEVIAVIQQIRRGAAVVPHGVRVFDGGAEAVEEVRGLDLMLRVVQNVALGGGDLRIVPDAVIGVLVVHAEQGDAVFAALLSGLDHSAVFDPVILVQLIQLELRAVQGVAVLCVHLLNGEEVLVVIVVTAVARPLRIEDHVTEHLDGIAFRVGFTAAVRLRVPAGESISAAGKAVCENCSCGPVSIGTIFVGHCAGATVCVIGHGVGGHVKLQLGGIFGGGFLALADQRKLIRINLDRTVDIAPGRDVQCRVAAQFVLRVSGQGQGDPGKGDDGIVGINIRCVSRILDHAGDRPITGGFIVGRRGFPIKLKPAAFKGDAVQRSRVFQLVAELDVQVHLAAGERGDVLALHEPPERTGSNLFLNKRNGGFMLRISTKFQALHIQRGLIGDLGVLIDNVRGGIVTVRRSGIDAVLNGNVIVDQIRGDGFPFGSEFHIVIRHDERIVLYGHIFIICDPAVKFLTVRNSSRLFGGHSDVGCSFKVVFGSLIGSKVCQLVSFAVAVNSPIGRNLAVQVPGVCARFHIIGRAVVLFQFHPFDQIKV